MPKLISKGQVEMGSPLGQYLTEKIASQKLTVAQVAFQARISKYTLNRILAGTENARTSLSTIQKIETALRCHIPTAFLREPWVENSNRLYKRMAKEHEKSVTSKDSKTAQENSSIPNTTSNEVAPEIKAVAQSNIIGIDGSVQLRLPENAEEAKVALYKFFLNMRKLGEVSIVGPGGVLFKII